MEIFNIYFKYLVKEYEFSKNTHIHVSATIMHIVMNKKKKHFLKCSKRTFNIYLN